MPVIMVRLGQILEQQNVHLMLRMAVQLFGHLQQEHLIHGFWMASKLMERN